MMSSRQTFSAAVDFEKDLKAFMQSQNLLCVIMMMYTITEDRKLKRQIAVFTPDDKLRDKVTL